MRRSFFQSIGPEASQILVGVGSMFCGPAAPVCAAAGTYDLNRAFGASSRDALFSAVFAGMSAGAFQAVGMMGLDPVGAFFVGGMVGGTMSYMQGGSFGNGFLSAGIGAAAGAYGGGKFSPTNLLISTAAGGTASYITGGKFANGAASAAFSYAMSWAAQKYGPGGDSYSSGSTNMGDEGTAEERLATANKAKEVLATVYGKKAENIEFVDEYMGLEESSWLTPWKKIPKSFSSRAEFDKWLDEKAGRGVLHAVTGPTRKITIYRSGVIGASGSLYLPNNTSVTGTFTPLEFAAINMGHELWHASGRFGRETMMNDKPHTYSNLNGYSWCLALGGCRNLTIK